MKQLNFFWMISALALFMFVQCSSSPSSNKEFSLSGTISDAANLTATLSSFKANNSLENLASTNLDEEGNFEISMEERPEVGIYRFAIGQKATQIIIGGDESQISIKGNLDDLPRYTYTIEGSGASSEVMNLLDQVRGGQADINQIKSFAVNSTYPLAGLMGSFLTTRGSAQMISTFESALKRVSEKHGSTNSTYEYYNNFVQQLKKRNAGPINVGQDAPDIEMEGPDGNTYRLSDLEGKIVLLDFWASWCRPCRKANPHVVEIYNKYKDLGFTVFSVSLDGLDQRTKQRLGGDQERIEKYLEQQESRWIKAIQDDNLMWDYHVSDLKKWDSEAAAIYGVRSIPRTFLIDREGKIAAVNPRNNLEEQLLAVLNKD